jgi:hypothetical protein
MMKTLLLFSVLVLTPSPGRACGVSEEEMDTMRNNRVVATANHCENAIVRPGSAIGAIWVGESAEDAVKAQAQGFAFEIEDGKVVRVKHTAAAACIQTGTFTPLRVITATSAFTPIAGVAITRDAGGVHVAVQRS